MFYKIYAFLKQVKLQILLLSNNPLESDKIHLLMIDGEDLPAQMHLEAPEKESWHLT